jgi:RNA polymerase sigma-70 factor (ECF subfamily)
MYLASKILPGGGSSARSGAAAALDELEVVYGFIYSRVGNLADAEDLTQQVALKALHRLRDGTPAPAVRSYLFATARSVLATFWSGRARLPEAELPDEVVGGDEGHEVLPSDEAAAWVAHILDGLTSSQRRVLELRFLRGYSLREVAGEMGQSVGSVKVLQLRALRKAASIGNPRELPVGVPEAHMAGPRLSMQLRRV